MYGAGRSEFDSGADKVEIFDEHGHAVTSLNILRAMAGAQSVSIYDVSARPGGPIAVAAVFTRGDGDQEILASSLLLFNFAAQLLSAYAIGPTRAIRCLTVDENSNIWTLTDNFEATDPANTPMVVEYTAEGSVVREELPHSVLWSPHRTQPKETPNDGRISMGADSGAVWFWLPGSTDLITISPSDGRLTDLQTQLPKRDNYTEVPLDLVRTQSGDVVAVFREDGDNGQSQLSHYTWSRLTMSWSPFSPGACAGDRLIGTGEAGQ